MTDRRKRQIRWVICFVGLIGSVFAFKPDLQDGGKIDANYPDNLRQPKAQFPVPPPHPRESGIGLTREFLFQMADSDKYTGKEREARLLARYEDVVNDDVDGKLPPVVSVETTVGAATIKIAGKPFVTVLPQDCPEYYSRLDTAMKLELEEEVAYSWARLIQEDLALQTVKRNPVYLQLYNYVSILLFWITAMAYLATDWIGRRFVRSPLWSVKLLVWALYITLLTALHPSLDDLANLLSHGALTPIFNMVLFGIAALGCHKLTKFFLARYFHAWTEYDRNDLPHRTTLRRQTLLAAWLFVSKAAWTVLAIAAFFRSLGVDLSALFAGAGLVGVAIGVMARDIFLDFFNGINILAEDQFVVGDWIEANNETGEVVDFSLRSTKMRRSDGSLATIPNSDLRRVRNHSNEYSTIDFRILLDYRTNTDFALALIMEELAHLETEWQDKLTAPPEPLGVQSLGPGGVVLRVKIRTNPLAQWEMERRLNRRVKMRFDEEGIAFAGASTNVQMVWTNQPQPEEPGLLLPSPPQSSKAKPRITQPVSTSSVEPEP